MQIYNQLSTALFPTFGSNLKSAQSAKPIAAPTKKLADALLFVIQPTDGHQRLTADTAKFNRLSWFSRTYLSVALRLDFALTHGVRFRKTFFQVTPQGLILGEKTPVITSALEKLAAINYKHRMSLFRSASSETVNELYSVLKPNGMLGYDIQRQNLTYFPANLSTQVESYFASPSVILKALFKTLFKVSPINYNAQPLFPRGSYPLPMRGNRVMGKIFFLKTTNNTKAFNTNQLVVQNKTEVDAARN